MTDPTSIQAYSMACVKAFEDLVNALQIQPSASPGDMSLDVVEHEFGRFKIWCGNLAALSKGRGSLDVRLRDSGVMRHTVVMFLVKLRETMERSTGILKGIYTPWERLELPAREMDAMDSDEDQYALDDALDDTNSISSGEYPTELVEMQSEIEQTVTNMYRLSFKIRNARDRLPSIKALSTKCVDPDSGIDLFDVYKEYDRNHVLASLRSLRQKSKQVRTGPNPERSLKDMEPAFLIDRLSSAITNRRRYFAYWQQHAWKLAQDTGRLHNHEAKLAANMSSSAQGGFIEPTERNQTRNALNNNAVAVTQSSAAQSTTTHSRYRIHSEDSIDAESVLSFATTAKDVDGRTAQLPPPPAPSSLGSEFVCPYCHLVCPTQEGHGRLWRKHILQDLQPYVCTYQDCSDGPRLYSNREEWVDHERLCHRRTWRCFFPEHRNEFFKSEAHLREHLTSDHEALTDLHVDTSLDLAETTVTDTRTVCPICHMSGPFDQGIYNHIAYHQEALSTFALPRGPDEDDKNEARSNDSNVPQLFAPSHDGLSNSQETLGFFGEFGKVGINSALGLCDAAEKGDAELVKQLLSEEMDTQITDEDRNRALQIASHEGFDQVVRLLIDQGADVNAWGDEHGSPLHAAAGQGHVSIIKMLLDHSASMNAGGDSDGTALYVASWKNHLAAVQVLLNAGADINMRRGPYGNALQAASYQGHEEIVKLLLSRKADPKMEGGIFEDAAEAAASQGHEKIVQLLRNPAPTTSRTERNFLGWSEDIDSYFPALFEQYQLYGPKYLFRIDEIAESANVPVTVNTLGQREPSIFPGANERIAGGVSGIWWYHRGDGNIQRLDPEHHPPPVLHYKTYSMFWKGGFGFWVLDCDAVSPSANTSGWNPLRFEHDPNDGYSSYLTYNGPHGTLACQRADQTWVQQLLPEIYHGPITPYDQYGALKGELGIFLGLLAFCPSRNGVHTRGRTDGRGVVIYVYTCPSNWDGGSTWENLRDYEHGLWYNSKYCY